MIKVAFWGGTNNVPRTFITLDSDQYERYLQGRDWDEILTVGQWSQLDQHFGNNDWFMRRNIHTQFYKED